MSIHTIHPYVSKWQALRVWVFDDPEKGLESEGLVSGTDQIMDRLALRFPNGEEGFRLTFGDEAFEGYELVFDWFQNGSGKDLADGLGGNWYRERSTGMEGWLCPALFKYFTEAPKTIFVRAEALEGKLERGTGRVVIMQ